MSHRLGWEVNCAIPIIEKLLKVLEQLEKTLFRWNHKPDSTKCLSCWFSPSSWLFPFLQIAIPQRRIAVETGAASPWSGCVTATTTAWISRTRSTAVSALSIFSLLSFPFLACLDQDTQGSLSKQHPEGKILTLRSSPRTLIIEGREDSNSAIHLTSTPSSPEGYASLGQSGQARVCFLSHCSLPLLSTSMTLSKEMFFPEAGGFPFANNTWVFDLLGRSLSGTVCGRTWRDLPDTREISVFKDLNKECGNNYSLLYYIIYYIVYCIQVAVTLSSYYNNIKYGY